MTNDDLGIRRVAMGGYICVRVELPDDDLALRHIATRGQIRCREGLRCSERAVTACGIVSRSRCGAGRNGAVCGETIVIWDRIRIGRTARGGHHCVLSVATSHPIFQKLRACQINREDDDRDGSVPPIARSQRACGSRLHHSIPATASRLRRARRVAVLFLSHKSAQKCAIGAAAHQPIQGAQRSGMLIPTRGMTSARSDDLRRERYQYNQRSCYHTSIATSCPALACR